MTTVLKAANYTEDQVTAITAAYLAGDSLESIAASVGKSVPSVRAKLSSLKVYVSKVATKPASEKTPKENKEALASLLSQLVGVDLLNVEAASKVALVALINAIKSRDEKIQSLIDDMLEGGE
jgi:predicted nucleotide-binding protein (sugar kinase/HSP70/actin superfamily)